MYNSSKKSLNLQERKRNAANRGAVLGKGKHR